MVEAAAAAAGSAGSSGLGGGGVARWMVARVTWGWKCGKECGAFGFGWRDISCWRSADSGSEGISQIDMPASPLTRMYSSVFIARHTHRYSCDDVAGDKIVTSDKIDFA